MAAPELLVEFTTDPPGDTTPTWVDVTSDVRSFSINRGRDNELSRVEAGTATVVLNNRSRDYDPTDDATLTPMNRWRITAVLDGDDEVMFLGYVESYEQQWPSVGKDAVTVVSLVDEFKVLALDLLPTTDPPQASYQDLVMFDQPVAYWPMSTPSDQLMQNAVVGPVLQAQNGIGFANGQPGTPPTGHEPLTYIFVFLTSYLLTEVISSAHSSGLDPAGLTEVTFELWWQYGASSGSGAPVAQEWVYRGPPTSVGTPWGLLLNTDGSLTATVRDSGGTAVEADSAVLSEDTWYHIVGTVTGGTFRLYIDGTQVDSVAFTGPIAAISTPGALTVGNVGNDIGSNKFRSYNHVAFYRYGLSADRVTAHYQAGSARGFERGEYPGDRMEAVLDSAGSTAARDIQTGSRQMVGSYMTGQPVLDELRRAEQAEAVDAVLFIAKDGTITFLADGYRSGSPYSSVQATFDDDGTDLPYQGISIDYSDSYLANEWNATEFGGTFTYTASDATSITDYFKRPQSLTDIPIYTDTDVEDIADAMLAKYKDPITRINGLELLATEEVAEAVLPLDIGHRIRVFRTQPTGGRIDQTTFIQRIAIDGVPGEPWRIRLGVSPL